jgi:octaprenyl-diphosphate synthase
MRPRELFDQLADLTGRVNRTLTSVLEADQGFFGEVGVYSLLGGGKRLRPLIYCLTLDALGGEVDDEAVVQASGFELLHMATLMHDDIIDQSDTRRGRSSVHRVFGVPETVMAADYLIAKAGLLTLGKSDLRIMRLIIELLRDLSLGELAELKGRRETGLAASAYMDIIYKKTAVLMETVCRAAAVLAEADEALSRAVADYGRLTGLAFQIVDDALDYMPRPGALGKPVGQDLGEGRITLPFIRALEALEPGDRERLAALGSAGEATAEERAEARALVERGRGVELAMAEARGLSKKAAEALSPLKPSASRDLLAELAAYAVERDR